MNHFVPFNDVTVSNYEKMMANREYWDDLGAEWSWSPVEKKLVRLAGLVQQVGRSKGLPCGGITLGFCGKLKKCVT